MATPVVADDEFRLILGPLEQFAAVHQGDVVVPIADIERVEAVAIARAHVPSIHFPGVDVPGLAKIGKFVKDPRAGDRSERTFASAHGSRPGYVITTKSGDPYQRIVFSTPPVPELDALIDQPSSQ